jgi:hypothetical protein
VTHGQAEKSSAMNLEEDLILNLDLVAWWMVNN